MTPIPAPLTHISKPVYDGRRCIGRCMVPVSVSVVVDEQGHLEKRPGCRFHVSTAVAVSAPVTAMDVFEHGIINGLPAAKALRVAGDWKEWGCL